MLRELISYVRLWCILIREMFRAKTWVLWSQDISQIQKGRVRNVCEITMHCNGKTIKIFEVGIWTVQSQKNMQHASDYNADRAMNHKVNDCWRFKSDGILRHVDWYRFATFERILGIFSSGSSSPRKVVTFLEILAAWRWRWRHYSPSKYR